MKPENFPKSLRPAFDTAGYARLATAYCENRLGGVEGNEIIVAALMIAQAIRANSHDLVEALGSIQSTIETLDNTAALSALEDMLRSIDGGLSDVAARS